MNALDITRLRLWNQHIARPRLKRPEDVVASLGAIQAQDFPGAKWSIGLRLPNATEVEVEKAISDRKIVRTWPMRGTLHFVAAADVRWMLALLTPRIVAGAAKRHLQLELDDKVFARSQDIVIKALQGGRQLTRDVLSALLEKGRIPMNPHRAYHIFWKHAQDGLICFGAHEKKQPTFTLLDEWIPVSKKLEREAALAELAHRYFIGHGPATLHDFVWWSGLKISDTRIAINLVAKQLVSEVISDKTYWMSPDLPQPDKIQLETYLLPGFDEYLLGYTDRSATLDPKYAQRICPGSNGMFIPTVVINGRVVATWKKTVKKAGITLTPSAFTSLTKAQLKTLAIPADRYGKFLGSSVTVSP